MFKPAALNTILKRFERLSKDNMLESLQKAAKEQEVLWNALYNQSGGVVILEGERALFLNRYALNYLEISESYHDSDSILELIRNNNLMQWMKFNVIEMKQGYQNRLFIINDRTVIASLELGEADRQSFTFLDVTDSIDEIEDVLRSEREESLSRLVAQVAHEIKNPLHSLQLHLRILENEMGDAKKAKNGKKDRVQKSLGVLLEETNRLDKLAHNFLKLGQLAKSRPVLTDIHQLLESVLDVFKPELEIHEIKLSTTFDRRLPKIPLQKANMHQVFANLVKNSIEAVTDKKGRLSIRTELVNHTCQIEFEDNGSGIDSKAMPRIFEPYFSTKKGGGGLGLILVKETVEKHGGKVQIESRPGKGVKVILFLPLKQAPLNENFVR